ncbi:hypothetical protein SUDANB58_04598 [Streptomyces sp. enrichment culture]
MRQGSDHAGPPRNGALPFAGVAVGPSSHDPPVRATRQGACAVTGAFRKASRPRWRTAGPAGQGQAGRMGRTGRRAVPGRPAGHRVPLDDDREDGPARDPGAGSRARGSTADGRGGPPPADVRVVRPAHRRIPHACAYGTRLVQGAGTQGDGGSRLRPDVPGRRAAVRLRDVDHRGSPAAGREITVFAGAGIADGHRLESRTEDRHADVRWKARAPRPTGHRVGSPRSSPDRRPSRRRAGDGRPRPRPAGPASHRPPPRAPRGRARAGNARKARQGPRSLFRRSAELSAETAGQQIAQYRYP